MAPQQWVDGPWKLIETPGYTRDPKSHGAIHCADEMAHIHNCIIRGMNSIYLQAPYVSLGADISDFLFFIKAWCDFVNHHHQVEEDVAFPELEAVTGQPGSMEGNTEQHHLFQPRLARLADYGRETKVEGYSGERVRELVRDLGDVLREHLADEIPTLMALEKFDSEEIMKVFKKCEKAAFEFPKELLMPMVLGLSDNTYEEGKNQFPPVPGIARYIVYYWYRRYHRGAWRFLPCDMWGIPQPLQFVEKA